VLVVGDPLENLPHARAETALVEDKLRARGFSLLAVDKRSRSEVLAALGAATLFHYAGHGVFVDSEDGLESGLHLASGRLTVADALAMKHAPGVVVLSACEAGRADARRVVAGLSHALLAAGTRSVLAPTRKVSDDASQELVRALYTSWPTDAAGSGLADAVSRAASSMPERSEWSAYRITTSGW
jgi:CHAT domain-containing protein